MNFAQDMIGAQLPTAVSQEFHEEAAYLTEKIVNGFTEAVRSGDLWLAERSIQLLNTFSELRHVMGKSKAVYLAQLLVDLKNNRKASISQEVSFMDALSNVLEFLRRFDDVEFTIEWRPLYDRFMEVHFPAASAPPCISGALRGSHRSKIVSLICCARNFFTASAPSEILSLTAEPLQNPYSRDCFRALGITSLFLPCHPATAAAWERARDGCAPCPEDSAWLEQWLELWGSIDHTPEWDWHWLILLYRVSRAMPPAALAAAWRPHLPLLVTRLVAILYLPTRSGLKPFRRNWPARLSGKFTRRTSRTHAMVKKAVKLLLLLLGVLPPQTQVAADAVAGEEKGATEGGAAPLPPSSPVTEALLEVMCAIRTYFHPSNSGGHSDALGHLINCLAENLARRVGLVSGACDAMAEEAEAKAKGDKSTSQLLASLPTAQISCLWMGITRRRFRRGMAAHPCNMAAGSSGYWDGQAQAGQSGRGAPWLVPDIARLLRVGVLEVTFHSVCSKSSSLFSSASWALRHLCAFAPRTVLRCTLPHAFTALDPQRLSESHLAPAYINVLTGLVRPLFSPLPLLAPHLPSLLSLTLPGIDPNDSRKTLITLNFYRSLLSHLPLAQQADRPPPHAMRVPDTARAALAAAADGDGDAQAAAEAEATVRQVCQSGVVERAGADPSTARTRLWMDVDTAFTAGAAADRCAEEASAALAAAIDPAGALDAAEAEAAAQGHGSGGGEAAHGGGSGDSDSEGVWYEAWRASSSFADWAVALMDRLFLLLTTQDKPAKGGFSARMENAQGYLVDTVLTLLLQQLPTKDAEMLVRKAFSFVVSTPLPNAQANVIGLLAALSRSAPALTLSTVLPHCTRAILSGSPLAPTAAIAARPPSSPREVAWCLTLAAGAVAHTGAHLLPHKQSILAILALTLRLAPPPGTAAAAAAALEAAQAAASDDATEEAAAAAEEAAKAAAVAAARLYGRWEDAGVGKLAYKLLRRTLRALTDTDVSEYRSLPPQLWQRVVLGGDGDGSGDGSGSGSGSVAVGGSYQCWGWQSTWRDLDAQWHTPSPQELQFAELLLHRFLVVPLRHVASLLALDAAPSAADTPTHTQAFASLASAAPSGGAAEQKQDAPTVAAAGADAVASSSTSLLCAPPLTPWRSHIHSPLPLPWWLCARAVRPERVWATLLRCVRGSVRGARSFLHDLGGARGDNAVLPVAAAVASDLLGADPTAAATAVAAATAAAGEGEGASTDGSEADQGGLRQAVVAVLLSSLRLFDAHRSRHRPRDTAPLLTLVKLVRRLVSDHGATRKKCDGFRSTVMYIQSTLSSVSGCARAQARMQFRSQTDIPDATFLAKGVARSVLLARVRLLYCRRLNRMANMIPAYIRYGPHALAAGPPPPSPASAVTDSAISFPTLHARFASLLRVMVELAMHPYAQVRRVAQVGTATLFRRFPWLLSPLLTRLNRQLAAPPQQLLLPLYADANSGSGSGSGCGEEDAAMDSDEELAAMVAGNLTLAGQPATTAAAAPKAQLTDSERADLAERTTGILYLLLRPGSLRRIASCWSHTRQFMLAICASQPLMAALPRDRRERAEIRLHSLFLEFIRARRYLHILPDGSDAAAAAAEAEAAAAAGGEEEGEEGNVNYRSDAVLYATASSYEDTLQRLLDLLPPSATAATAPTASASGASSGSGSGSEGSMHWRYQFMVASCVLFLLRTDRPAPLRAWRYFCAVLGYSATAAPAAAALATAESKGEEGASSGDATAAAAQQQQRQSMDLLPLRQLAGRAIHLMLSTRARLARTAAAAGAAPPGAAGDGEGEGEGDGVAPLMRAALQQPQFARGVVETMVDSHGSASVRADGSAGGRQQWSVGVGELLTEARAGGSVWPRTRFSVHGSVAIKRHAQGIKELARVAGLRLTQAALLPLARELMGSKGSERRVRTATAAEIVSGLMRAATKPVGSVRRERAAAAAAVAARCPDSQAAAAAAEATAAAVGDSIAPSGEEAEEVCAMWVAVLPLLQSSVEAVSVEWVGDWVLALRYAFTGATPAALVGNSGGGSGGAASLLPLLALLETQVTRLLATAGAGGSGGGGDDGDEDMSGGGGGVVTGSGGGGASFSSLTKWLMLFNAHVKEAVGPVGVAAVARLCQQTSGSAESAEAVEAEAAWLSLLARVASRCRANLSHPYKSCRCEIARLLFLVGSVCDARRPCVSATADTDTDSGSGSTAADVAAAALAEALWAPIADIMAAVGGTVEDDAEGFSGGGGLLADETSDSGYNTDTSVQSTASTAAGGVHVPTHSAAQRMRDTALWILCCITGSGDARFWADAGLCLTLVALRSARHPNQDLAAFAARVLRSVPQQLSLSRGCDALHCAARATALQPFSLILQQLQAEAVALQQQGCGSDGGSPLQAAAADGKFTRTERRAALRLLLAPPATRDVVNPATTTIIATDAATTADASAAEAAAAAADGGAVGSALRYDGALSLAFAVLRLTSTDPSWRTRVSALTLLDTLVARHLFLLPRAHRAAAAAMLLAGTRDLKPEVMRRAALGMAGALAVRRASHLPPLAAHFTALARTRLPKPLRDAQKRRRRGGAAAAASASSSSSDGGTNPAAAATATAAAVLTAKQTRQLLSRQMGVLGETSLVLAFPYQLPRFAPPLLAELAGHASDPPPLCDIVRHAFTEFKRTHHDTWAQDQTRFSPRQLEMLSDMSVAPHYYV